MGMLGVRIYLDPNGTNSFVFFLSWSVLMSSWFYKYGVQLRAKSKFTFAR